MTAIIKALFSRPCHHVGQIVCTTTYHHGRTICDGCGFVFAEWRR